MKVVVVIERGVCQRIYSDDVSVEVQVIDKEAVALVDDPERYENAVTDGLTEVY